VQAVVVPGEMPFVLLGNSFLGRFQLRQENDVLRLQRR
jgi:aspartyl protease family protein